ncbi:MAG: amidase family protein [Bacteroidetes bacterium]|nr:amidase family protein [Bacteroidota bacterium]MDA0888388.1 amidase family protein [Bacteroidota bacterium]MDA1084448.1 amidase family protein [Bacteroidota bacterium]
MKKLLLFLLFAVIASCSQPAKQYWKPYDESVELLENETHENSRMRYKLIQSKFHDKNVMWSPFEKALNRFGDKKYNDLKPLIIEQNIPTIQQHIASGNLSYEDLVTFYLYRIRLLESNPETTLHAVLALNPNIIEEAKQNDADKPSTKHPIYGMPILLKDNMNTANMPTTAGAAILEHHFPDEDAFVVKKLKENGALILGKVNLSEWAYYFCDGCPLGYSAIGGQTLNPYGRKIFETGGSSSGSGVSVAANYAVAALGSETSGSILSPSSKNAVVGLKPTIGLVSRTGIVPISSTLDTSGPMTKNVTDNAILLDAITAVDQKDSVTLSAPRLGLFLESTKQTSLKGIRLGAISALIETDSLYRDAIDDLKKAGAEVVKMAPTNVSLSGFATILSGDMKRDLPAYFSATSTAGFSNLDVQKIINFNSSDSLRYMPYNQARLDGVLADTVSAQRLVNIKKQLNKNASSFFDTPIKTHKLDAVLSINNYHAAYAAIAFYPCLTVPMGYSELGEPKGLTFIAPSFNEEKLLSIAAGYENISKQRKLPKGYE